MEKRGGRKTSRMTPLPKRGFGPPLVRYVFHPPQVSVLCFSCTKISTTEQPKSSFGGVQKFSGERVLWYVFLPPYVLHPPISRPKRKRGGQQQRGKRENGRVNQRKTSGLIQHVLTVLVCWSWVLLLPRLPPSSRSLRFFPRASILLHGPLDICLDLLPAAPLPPVQKQDAHHKFLQHSGAHAEWKQAS